MKYNLTKFYKIYIESRGCKKQLEYIFRKENPFFGVKFNINRAQKLL